jgi:uncharacterized protein YbjT (DUF2867 family)
MKILITGATGQQGGAVARELLEHGHDVRGLTRSPASAAAEALASLGVELVTGDFDDAGSLERAAQGVDAVFAMSTPFESGGIEAEERQAMELLDATAAAGVEHVVLSSIANADTHTGVPHFEAKLRVEQYLRALDVPYTIVAPVSFMENLFSPWTTGLEEGRLEVPLPASRSRQQIAVQDIGRFVAHVLENRETFLGRRIDIASDEFTGSAAAETLSRASGHGIEYVEVPIAQVRSWSEDLALMNEWFDRVGYGVDIEGLRGDYPEIGWHTLGHWAQAQDWSAVQWKEATPA